MISIEHALSHLEPWLASYGAFALFVAIYLESFGLPLPARERACGRERARDTRGSVDHHSLCGGLVGCSARRHDGLPVGRLGGSPLLMRFGPHIGLTAERFERVAAEVSRYGFMLVMLARFVVLPRQLNGLVAGARAMSPTRFVPANMIGAVLWVAT